MKLSAQLRGCRSARQTETRITSVVGSLLILFVAGCAHIPARQGLHESGGASLNALALEDPGLRKFMGQQLNRSLGDWPLHTWDETGLTLAAWYFNPRLNEVRSQWQRAEANRFTVEGWPNLAKPETQSFPDGMLSEFSAGVIRRAAAETSAGEPPAPRLSTPANSRHTSPTQLHQIATARRAAEASRLRLQAVAWQVRSQLCSNLLAYAAAQRGESLLQELETAYVKLIQVEEDGDAEDSMPSLRVSLLRLQLAQVRLVLVQTRLAKMENRSRLADALNVPVSALFEIEVTNDFSRVAAGVLSVPALRWRALQSRLDILLVLAEYRGAEDGLRSEIAKHRLRLPFPAACRWDENANRWMVNLDVGVSEGRSGKALAKAESCRVAVAARLLNLQTDIIDEVERSAAVYRMTATEVAGIDALIDAIVQDYGGVERGKKGQFPPKISGQAEALARLQVLTARFAKFEAQVRLQTALGALENALQQCLPTTTMRPTPSLSPKATRDEMQPSTHIL